jgi:hypothetical protein
MAVHSHCHFGEFSPHAVSYCISCRFRSNLYVKRAAPDYLNFACSRVKRNCEAFRKEEKIGSILMELPYAFQHASVQVLPGLGNMTEELFWLGRRSLQPKIVLVCSHQATLEFLAKVALTVNYAIQESDNRGQLSIFGGTRCFQKCSGDFLGRKRCHLISHCQLSVNPLFEIRQINLKCLYEPI